MDKAAVSTPLGPALGGRFGAGDAAGSGVLLLVGLVLVAAVGGAAIAFADVNALYLALAIIGCAFILFDFRIGVVLLILLLPISRSALFPHAMMGVTGLNPLNLLLVGTLAAYLLQTVTDGSLRRFLPAPVFWLYMLPLVVAGAIGSRHVGDIAPIFSMYEVIEYDTPAKYLLELVFKPLMLVVFALLLGAAVAKSERPERFLAPTIVSIWVMGAMVVVFVALSGVKLSELASSEARGFLSDLGMHANELGRLYTVAYALLLFTWAETRSAGLKAILVASMALVVLALVLTFSRSAFMGFLVVNGLYLLWRLSARTLILAAFVVAVAIIATPAAVYDRMSAGFGEGWNAISAGRIDGLWLPLLPEVLRHPVLGNGHGSILWSEAMRAGGGETVLATTHPHSAYLQALLDMGIVGLVLVCAYFVHVWRRLRKLGADPDLSPTLRGFFQGAAAGLLCFLFVGIADSSLMPKAEQAFLWLAIGMMYGVSRRPAT